MQFTWDKEFEESSMVSEDGRLLYETLECQMAKAKNPTLPFSPLSPKMFQRDGNDLHMTHKIGLVEALCGFQFTFKHLDARQIVVKYPPGKVIEPGKNLYTAVLKVLPPTNGLLF